MKKALQDIIIFLFFVGVSVVSFSVPSSAESVSSSLSGDLSISSDSYYVDSVTNFSVSGSTTITYTSAGIYYSDLFPSYLDDGNIVFEYKIEIPDLVKGVEYNIDFSGTTSMVSTCDFPVSYSSYGKKTFELYLNGSGSNNLISSSSKSSPSYSDSFSFIASGNDYLIFVISFSDSTLKFVYSTDGSDDFYGNPATYSCDYNVSYSLSISYDDSAFYSGSFDSTSSNFALLCYGNGNSNLTYNGSTLSTFTTYETGNIIAEFDVILPVSLSSSFSLEDYEGDVMQLSISDLTYTLNTVSYTNYKIPLSIQSVYLNYNGQDYLIRDGSSVYIDVSSAALAGADLSDAFTLVFHCFVSAAEISICSTSYNISSSASVIAFFMIPARSRMPISRTRQDTLTNGYDNSSMASDNSTLSSSISEYEDAQAGAMDESNGYIDSVEYTDVSSHANLISAIAFSGSWLQALFTNLGDFSYLIIISLSFVFGLMLVGWLKYRK